MLCRAFFPAPGRAALPAFSPSREPAGMSFLVAVPTADTAAPSFGALSAFGGLALRFDGMAVCAYALDLAGVENWGAGNAQRGQTFDVVHFLDALGAAGVLESACLIAPAHLAFDAV
jgi:hypothetical protein